MKSALLVGVVSTVWIVFTGTSMADESYLDVVQKLRNEGQFDRAILYLDELSANKETPADIKQVIPYQKAITLIASAKTVRSPRATRSAACRKSWTCRWAVACWAAS